MRRSAMWLLHAGYDPGGGFVTRASPEAHGRPDSRGARREPMPLHGLHADLRGGACGGADQMRVYVPGYELVAARDLGEALRLLGAGWRPLAGGTDVMVLFEAAKLAHRKWVSIRGLAELRGMEVAPEHVTIGALTTYTDVRRNALLAAEFPMLGEAAALTGGIATQNRGTLGGNIVNASPAADTPPALLAYDAEVELLSARGARWVPYTQFHTGYKQMDLAADELLARIRLPRRFGRGRHY